GRESAREMPREPRTPPPRGESSCPGRGEGVVGGITDQALRYVPVVRRRHLEIPIRGGDRGPLRAGLHDELADPWIVHRPIRGDVAKRPLQGGSGERLRRGNPA